ncbi:MAG: hypothetical protein AB7O91_10540 [Sphingomonas sp.]
MTHQPPPFPIPANEPGRQVQQLREVLALVEGIAGRRREPADGLDEAARATDAYDRAPPIAQRRFDALAAESAAWAAAGVEALLAAEGRTPIAAARRLADALGRALNDLAATLDPPAFRAGSSRECRAEGTESRSRYP